MFRQSALHINCNSQRQRAIGQYLKTLGFHLDKARNLQEAQEKTKVSRYRLILMDYETLGTDIIDFCSFIRNGSDNTILIGFEGSN